MARALVIDEAARAAVARVLAHAQAHPYRPDHDTSPPGDDDRFIACLNSFRAVFSFTHIDDEVFRHLSISVPGGKYPHPFGAYTIAALFGFTGWDERTVEPPPEGWMIRVNQQERCVVLAQSVVTVQADRRLVH